MAKSSGRRLCARCRIIVTGPCPTCSTDHQARDRERGSAASRGYDAKWRKRRAQYLKYHPVCVLCDQAAEVADHWPLSRRELLAQGAEHPDSDEHLRPLCKRHHDQETAKNQPGGWNATSRRIN